MNLNLLHPQILQKLRTAMCFIAILDGKEHAATIVRLPSSEFRDNLESTLVRLYIDLYRSKDADVFSFYDIVADSKNLWSTETWIFPYDDELIGPSPDDPLSKEARKRLNLLLSQEFSHAIFVDESNSVRCIRKITYTTRQKKCFAQLADELKRYKGKRISLQQGFSAVLDYREKVPKSSFKPPIREPLDRRPRGNSCSNHLYRPCISL